MSLPSETPPGATAYRFGPFELDVDALELRRHGLKVRLRGRPIEILVALLEHRGGPVSRDDLRTRLWSSDTYVDFDHGLNSAMNKLREALGDSAENPRYIETLPRRGYRFVAPVEVIVVSPPSRSTEPASAVDAPPPSEAQPLPAAPPLRPRWWFWLTTLLVTATVAIAATFVISRWRAPFSGRTMLVVLPFENRSGNAADEFFSDGITDEMIAQLGALDEPVGRLGPAGHRLGVMPVLGKPGQQGLDRLLRPTLPRPDAHQRGVDDDAVQPGGEAGVAVEPVDGAHRRQHRLLHRVAGGVLVPEHPAGDRQQTTSQRSDHLLVRRLVASLQSGDQPGISGVGVHGGIKHRGHEFSPFLTTRPARYRPGLPAPYALPCLVVTHSAVKQTSLVKS
jgi:DNA-binding winged helix-turn-helix (wHTH) protein